MQSLFEDIEPEPHQVFPKKSRLTAGVCGRGPAGETCKTCAYLIRQKHSSKTFLKCGLMRHYWTHGPGSDIRAGWEACEHWKATGEA